jgi:1-aminocyclopropane-1-carboxylate deaminase
LGVPNEDWSINLNYRYGGFGSTPSEIAEFQQSMLSTQNLPLDTVYNSKSLKALITDLELGNLPADGKYVYINTGGLI